jgi:hypothetical protein
MTCISLDLVFDLAKLCDASMPPFHTYWKLHKKLLEVGWKEGKIPIAFGEDHTQWAIEWIIWGTYFLFAKLLKPPKGKLIKE